MIQRIVRPSRIRRGRMAVNPVWVVRNATEEVTFHARKDAAAFDDKGCREHEGKRGWCSSCRGVVEIARSQP